MLTDASRAPSSGAAIFPATYQLIDKGDLREAVKEAAAAELQHPRLAADFARLRAELHIALDEWKDADSCTPTMLATRPMGWPTWDWRAPCSNSSATRKRMMRCGNWVGSIPA